MAQLAQQAQSERGSRSCSMCRQRRVKCDKVSPTCGPCARRALLCSWFSPWQFEDQNDVVSRKYNVTGAAPDLGCRTQGTLEIIEYVPGLHNAAKRDKRSTGSGSSSADDDLQSRSSSLVSSSKPQLTTTVNSVPLMRLQMLAVALHHYLPSDERAYQCKTVEEWPTLNFLNSKNDSLVAAKPLVNAAVDAFTLAQACVCLSDPRLAFASIQRYNACLNTLSGVLVTRSGYTRCDLLLCMLLLVEIESIRPVAQQGGYFLHIQGVVQFLADEAPQCLTSCYETILFQRIRQASILLGLALGKWTPFGTRKFMTLSKSAPMVTSETRLLDIGVSIPNLLAGDYHDIRDYSRYSTLETIQQSLRHWIQEYRCEKGVVSQAFDPAQFPEFTRLVAPNLEGEMLFFKRFNDAFYLSLAWSLSFLVQSAQLLILAHSFEPKPSECKQLETSLMQTAQLLFSTIPHFLDRDWGFVARSSINVFLQLLTRYYQNVGHELMVELCLAVKGALSRPEFGHAFVTDHTKIAFERYLAALQTVRTID